MSVLRQLNLLSQMRLDVPHIRALESSVAADFDVLAGRVMSGSKPSVIRGFNLANFSAGTQATSVTLVVADAILMNIGASESGTFLWVPSNRAPESLDAALNPKVSGGFTAGQVNYIGLDLKRSADSTTADLVQFLDANTLIEAPKTVPLARTLDYRIVISTVPFSAQPNLVPVAKIRTNASNQVGAANTDVADCRNLLYRLGAGGDFPDRTHAFGWAQGRNDFNIVTGPTIDPFQGGDKIFRHQKDWMDGVMTRLWELGGGESWYSPTADRNIRMLRSPPPAVFGSTTDNFEFISSNLHWQGLRIAFENSNGTATYYNQIADQLGNFPGLTDILPGECIYVDLDRTQNASVVARKAALDNLGVPSVPGSRIIIAWCGETGVISTRDATYPVNSGGGVPATISALGLVKLSRVPTTPAFPIVISDTGGTISPLTTGQTGLIILTNAGGGNGNGLTTTGTGTGSGVNATGGASSGSGGTFLGGASNGSGVTSTAVGTGAGGTFAGAGAVLPAISGHGFIAMGASAGGLGGYVEGGSASTGLVIKGGATSGLGLQVNGTGSAGGATIAAGLTGNGVGLTVTGHGTGTGVDSTGGANGIAVKATALGSGVALLAIGGTSHGIQSSSAFAGTTAALLGSTTYNWQAALDAPGIVAGTQTTGRAAVFLAIESSGGVASEHRGAFPIIAQGYDANGYSEFRGFGSSGGVASSLGVRIFGGSSVSGNTAGGDALHLFGGGATGTGAPGKGLTVSAGSGGTGNQNAIEATGSGTGAALVATAGATGSAITASTAAANKYAIDASYTGAGGAAIRGISSGATVGTHGIFGQTDSSNFAGVAGQANAASSIGVVGIGFGASFGSIPAGMGVVGFSSSTAGTYGGYFSAGATNCGGVHAIGFGSAAGILAHSGGSGYGVDCDSGLGSALRATGNNLQNAAIFISAGTKAAIDASSVGDATASAVLTGGYIEFTSPSNPALGTINLSNKITAKNVCKAWFRGTTNNGAGWTSQDGFNFNSSPTLNSNSIDFVFSTGMASGNYSVVCSVSFNSGTTYVFQLAPISLTSSGFSLTCQGRITGGVLSNFNALNTTASVEVNVQVFAAQ